MTLNIREMLPNERDYAYTQSYQLMSQSGCITLMRGDFGNGGKTFYPDYEDQIKQYRTKEFAAEFDSVIKEFYKVGILADRDSMLEYCCARPDGRFMGNFSREYGYRVDTEKYTYLLRCIPAPGDNNFYCYAYVSDLLNAHMEKAAQGIRFIDSHYNDLFRLPDGGSIIITHNGQKRYMLLGVVSKDFIDNFPVSDQYGYYITLSGGTDECTAQDPNIDIYNGKASQK